MSTTLADLATCEHLLVISDFDGTVAGLTTDIYGVPVNQVSVAALAQLSQLPRTNVAVLSGRHLEGLREVCVLREPVILAGSHGAESTDHGVELTDEMRSLLAYLEQELNPIVALHPAALLEYKPFQRVVHIARVAAEDPAAAQALLEKAAAIDPAGARLNLGKNIVEFSVAEVTKGTWISAERQRLQPSRTIFIGDDTTDEDGFRALEAGDLGVKVGPGDTAAQLRVADTDAVAELFALLAQKRAEYLAAES
ncbi:trehalose-phosphatase [Corynebacterium alimapuense]|uniref:Trehalose 6-phosphate phosphatase n=1 Tax=Corynebacterium alimapuense TaxID=1576874 RepID=A0A3M8KAG2_9CORY|nr:trehalose-phosphatase [Corynebacterium alimapuense]RNE49859.1 trehalose-phosphatase [Corynebacterium alimapuense]